MVGQNRRTGRRAGRLGRDVGSKARSVPRLYFGHKAGEWVGDETVHQRVVGRGAQHSAMVLRVNDNAHLPANTIGAEHTPVITLTFGGVGGRRSVPP